MTDQICVRRAEERDIPQIAKINAGVFLGDRDRLDGAKKWVSCWFSAYPLYQYFVVEVDGEVAGYAGWQVHGGFHRAEPVIELDQIGIDPNHQGNGLGGTLTRECMQLLLAWTKETNDRIESHITFTVWAYSLNFNAMSVYSREFTEGACGFRIQFGNRAENMLRVRLPMVRPVRKE